MISNLIFFNRRFSFCLIGQKLIRKGDFHIGQHINSFFRIKCRTSEVKKDGKPLTDADKRQVTVYG